MATPIMDERGLLDRLEEERQETAQTVGTTPAGQEDPLAASMREHAQLLRQQAQIARLRQMNEEAETDETRAAAARAQAETELKKATAEGVVAEVKERQSALELVKLENETKVQAMVAQGIPEAAARRALGLAAQGLAAPAVNADGTPTSVFSQFLDGMKAMVALNGQLEEMAARRIQSQQPQTQAMVPASQAPPTLSDEFRKMREMRAELGVWAQELGFVSQAELAALAKPPKEDPSTVMVDLRDLSRVPASMAVQVFEAQEASKARIYEINKRLEHDQKKWASIEGLVNQFFSIFDFKALGAALAQAHTPAPVANAPVPAPTVEAQTPPGLLKLQCGKCGQQAIFASREMILARQKAACTACGAVWDLEPAPSAGQAPPPPPANGNGHGDDMASAMAEILGR